jgi:nucleotide-binding universal stress UspA family protein
VSDVFHNVLLGIDGSASAAKALDRAIEIARASHGRLGLLSVAAEPSPFVAMAPFSPPISRAGLRAELEAEALRRLEEAEHAVPHDVPVTKLLAHGRTDDALLAQARDGPWDLIVVGERGRLGRLRKSPAPVLVVGSGAESIAAPAQARRFMRARRPSADRRSLRNFRGRAA